MVRDFELISVLVGTSVHFKEYRKTLAELPAAATSGCDRSVKFNHHRTGAVVFSIHLGKDLLSSASLRAVGLYEGKVAIVKTTLDVSSWVRWL
jgi:hypothetical protein